MNRQAAVIAAVLVFGFATGASAATSAARRHAGQETADPPMTYGAAADTDCSIAGSVRGKPYCFGSDGSRRRATGNSLNSHG